MKFVDRKGTEWDADINVGVVRRLKSEGVNFYALEENKAEGLRELFADDLAIVGYLWKILKPQADALGVSEEEFESRLGGVSLADAVRAFKEGYANFTRSPAIHSMISETLELERRAERATAKATAKVVELARVNFNTHESQISDEAISKLFADELGKRQKPLLNGSPT